MNRTTPNITMSVDIKKCRIRLHKPMLMELGIPQYIQILVNPEKMLLAIRSVEGKSAGDHTHRLKYKFKGYDQSVELYSESLVTKLYALVDKMDEKCTYRLEGEVNQAQKVAFFSLSNIKKCDM